MTTTAAKSRPIRLYAWEVRAILNGNKTQARRVVKPQPDDVKPLGRDGRFIPYRVGHEVPDMPGIRIQEPIKCPYGYGVPGDELWVRETWVECLHTSPATDQPHVCDGDKLIEHATQYTENGEKRWHYDGRVICYRATSDVEFCDGDGFTGDMANRDDMPRWRPSIHMPRWASRITLEVTGLRIERLNDISEADAIAEGCDVDLLASLIAPLANRAVVEPHYWLRNDAGRSFCRKCGEKKVRQINKDCREKNENLDGGWDTEEDGPAFCDTCGVMLDCTYTDHAVRDEIDHFSEYGITSPADAHSLETALHVHGNPRLTKSCGTFHYRPELTGTVAKICFRHLWESINGPDSWDANPWVWVVEFKQKECN